MLPQAAQLTRHRLRDGASPRSSLRRSSDDRGDEDDRRHDPMPAGSWWVVILVPSANPKTWRREEELMSIRGLFALCLVPGFLLSAEQRFSKTPAAVVGKGTLPFVEMAKSREIVPNVATEESHINLVFPVVGSAGVFRTEATLVNHTPRAQLVDAYYLPANGGAANCNLGALRLRLEAETTYFYEDFVSDVFDQSGFGSVFLFAVRDLGGPDATAQLDGTARIWAPAAGGGTASQTFPSMSIDVGGVDQVA